MSNTKDNKKNHLHQGGVLNTQKIRVLADDVWRSAVPVLSRARDGVVTTANNWSAWRVFIRQILTRPCAKCSGEGIVYWAVDGWHSEKCESCDGTGRKIMVSFF